VVPSRSPGASMLSRTTRDAPPEVVPATIRNRSSDWLYPLMAGLGPSYAIAGSGPDV
jgi:hypothetical protein